MSEGRAPRDRRARAPSTASLEEFRARLPLAEIVGRWVKLTRRGREWVGLCPFHQEKTPSFAVVEDKGFYHCFGCGAHGDAIGFVMAIERLDFKDALARLEELTGIPAPRRAAPGTEPVDRALYDANAAAARWFASRLEGPEGEAARTYLARRGLDPATIRSFGLGWAPADRTALRSALAARGFGEETLLAAGLLRRPEGGGTPYALFRERVIFPIADARGRIVGFGGRTLGDGQPKYLNTPDTDLFHKSRLLYGLDRAAEPARKSGRLVVAEGYMDVIALARAGVPAVAPLGTAMGEAQLEAAWKLVRCPIVCLDGDAAGLRAALRLAERAAPLLRADRSLAFVVLPEGEDPDSLLRAHGPAALTEPLARPEPLASFFFRVVLAQRAARLELAEERAALRRTLRDFVARIGDPDLRASLAEEFAALLASELARRRLDARALGGVRAGAVRNQRGPAPVRPARAVAASELRTGLARLEARREAALLAPILEEPAILGERGTFATVEEELAELELEDPALDRLRQETLALWSERHRLDAEELAAHLGRCGLAGPVARVRSASGTGGTAGGDEGGLSPLERWRAMAPRRRRRLDRERELEALSSGARDAFAGRPLGGLDRLLNERNEDAASEPVEHHTGRPPR